jgi:hypothetical protein
MQRFKFERVLLAQREFRHPVITAGFLHHQLGFEQAVTQGKEGFNFFVHVHDFFLKRAGSGAASTRRQRPCQWDEQRA